ncbi:hypothetical protein ACJVC5_18540 [Peredibacter sp. HCB2-198]|uniref:hypothetical protein n=1 Tax=Peredibacter sp. HCB2-198 TaxID=3383025 RepID=UPI0038B492EE
MRWICLPSEDRGQDWLVKSQELDARLPHEGMDLAEETVYLLFSGTPSEMLEGNGRTLIARSVIGPKKNLERPFELVDWKAAPVWRERLQGETLTELLEDAEAKRFRGEKEGRAFAKPFSICVRRRLVPGLKLETEVIFHE